MVDVLAAFGLGFTIVKVFGGVLNEVRHAGLVLVHDRTGKLCFIGTENDIKFFLTAYRRTLLFTVVAGSLVTVLLIVTGQ